MGILDKMRAKQPGGTKVPPIDGAAEKAAREITEPLIEAVKKDIGKIDVTKFKTKKEVLRKCCETMKGQSVPHDGACVTQKVREPKKKMPRHIGADLPDKGRWPSGTTVAKLWNGEAWECTVVVPCEGSFQGVHSGSLRSEQICTREYLSYLAKKEPAK